MSAIIKETLVKKRTVTGYKCDSCGKVLDGDYYGYPESEGWASVGVSSNIPEVEHESYHYCSHDCFMIDLPANNCTIQIECNPEFFES